MAATTDDPGDDLKDQLKHQLECPLCMFTCTAPIYLCVNGHNVCGTCQKTLNSCPVCRKEGRPSIRNLFAEEVSQNLWTQCINASQGCKDALKLKDMAGHLDVCEFGYSCVFDKCKWHGSVDALAKHAAAVHPRHYIVVHPAAAAAGGVGIAVESSDYDEEDDVHMTAMLAYDGAIFWLQVAVFESTSLEVVVRRIGGGQGCFATKIGYQLAFRSPDGRLAVTYSNKVRSLADGGHCVADSVFDDSFAVTPFLVVGDLTFALRMFDLGEASTAPEQDVAGRMEQMQVTPAAWPILKYRVTAHHAAEPPRPPAPLPPRGNRPPRPTEQPRFQEPARPSTPSQPQGGVPKTFRYATPHLLPMPTPPSEQPRTPSESPQPQGHGLQKPFCYAMPPLFPEPPPPLEQPSESPQPQGGVPKPFCYAMPPFFPESHRPSTPSQLQGHGVPKPFRYAAPVPLSPTVPPSPPCTPPYPTLPHRQ